MVRSGNSDAGAYALQPVFEMPLFHVYLELQNSLENDSSQKFVKVKADNIATFMAFGNSPKAK